MAIATSAQAIAATAAADRQTRHQVLLLAGFGSGILSIMGGAWSAGKPAGLWWVWPDFLAVGRNRRNSVILSAAKDLGEVGGSGRFFAALRMTDRTLST
jgi:hypothetical protein